MRHVILQAISYAATKQGKNFAARSGQKQTSHTMDEKESKFQKIFSSHAISIEHLREISYGGIPMKYRATAWRVLLGTQGLNVKNTQRSIEAKNAKYLKTMLKTGSSNAASCTEACKHAHAGACDRGSASREACPANIHVLFQTSGALLSSSLKLCKKHSHQIDIDVKRLSSRYKTFLNADISFLFHNILSVFAFRRPAIGYVQGMADILSLFIQVFCTEDTDTAESSSFYAFSKFIDIVQVNFIEGQPGIRHSILSLEKAVARSDPELFGKLESAGWCGFLRVAQRTLLRAHRTSGKHADVRQHMPGYGARSGPTACIGVDF
ncbi:UNVERIFIED_CONTAM: hypothetical protein PYX00_010809 [Menopon gallinae]|uniref:Rab-GAP TBC domain-containing protein n=1 Tax=Menopon gallinae TaxID=328185 RepID=A0AAW2H6J1_9NEOP